MYAYQCVLVVYELPSSQQLPNRHHTPEMLLELEMPDASPWAFRAQRHGHHRDNDNYCIFKSYKSNTARQQPVHHVHSALLVHHTICPPHHSFS